MPPKFKRSFDREDVRNSRDIERTALLDGNSDDEDFFLRGPTVNTNRLRDPKIERLQGQVHEVVGVMKDNVSKVLERGERLEELQDKSDSLASNSDMFRSRATGLRRQMWWNNCKVKLIIAVIILIIMAIIIIPIIVKSQNTEK
ncbi:vesicle-associated membrane protein 4-like [Liolophura sinensis]|uniref:vesicle-associated membrane protein 4-like n=1 Tax=Liolophura sinensis TaxID=3198878 RepID=UPI003158A487